MDDAVQEKWTAGAVEALLVEKQLYLNIKMGFLRKQGMWDLLFGNGELIKV